MNQHSAIRMVDILPLEPAIQPSSQLFGLILAIATLLLLGLVLRSYRQPLRRLQRKLLRQQLTARQAAHQLARMLPLNNEQQSQLQTLRFSRAEPDVQAVLVLIRQLQEK